MPKPATAKTAGALSRARKKQKGKKLKRREIVQLTAMREMGMGPYEIGAAMNRSSTTVYKYTNNPAFTDPKFKAAVESYKEKELIDLTMLNIESRARLHDLVTTMTPIEAIALMDRSFQQRRLLEGRSTENIFSLRKIISEAHDPLGSNDATDQKQIESSLSHERADRDSGGEATETSSGNSVFPAASEEEEA
jgi:hypothetical protein